MPGTGALTKINNKSIPKLAFYKCTLTIGIVAHYVKAPTSTLKLRHGSRRVLSEDIMYSYSYHISMLIRIPLCM